jgi:hypothetical protein
MNYGLLRWAIFHFAKFLTNLFLKTLRLSTFPSLLRDRVGYLMRNGCQASFEYPSSRG